MSRRREPRVEMDLEVKVWGLDLHGKSFMQHARTVDATRRGLRLIGIDCVRLGDVVGIQYGEQKARYKVIWIGRENTPKSGQIGLHRLEIERAAIRFQPLVQADDSPSSGAMTRGFGFEGVRKSPSARRDMPASRRKHPRYLCAGEVEIRQPEIGTAISGNLNDISLTGCYVETTTPLAIGSMLTFHIQSFDLAISGRAVVKTSHHGGGMGLAFLHLSADDQNQLEFLLASLAGQQQMLPENHRSTEAADQPVADQPASSWQSAPAEEPPAPATRVEKPFAGQIMRAITDLNELEQHLVKHGLDPRLIAQFHDAMEHTRQTAWTVQQWLDLRTSGGDPFTVLPQLEAERMHLLMKLSRNLMADIDAGAVNESSEGIAELYEMVQQIHHRLARMFGHDPEDEGLRFRAKK